MSAQANKEVVRNYLEQVVNTGDVAEIERYIAPEYTEVYQGVRYPVGIEGAREHVLGVRQTYPDLHLTIERQIAEGEWVATCLVARGTHSGTWMDLKPTGKPVTIYTVNVDRVVDGRLVEHGGAANMFEALLEIGAINLVRG